jgi:Fe-S-cluster-containing hydrogenase component 2
MKTVIVRPERCVGCLQCRLNCAVLHSRTRNLAGGIGGAGASQTAAAPLAAVGLRGAEGV